MFFWNFFKFIIREDGSTDVALTYLLSKAIDKKLNKDEVLLYCFDGCLI